MTDPQVVLYGRPSCQPCRLTKSKLEKAGVPFLYVDLDQDADALDGLTDEGWATALPVVVTPEVRWCGLDRDHLRDVCTRHGTR